MTVHASDRRTFLQATAATAGLWTLSSGGLWTTAFGAEEKKQRFIPPDFRDGDPDTLFLTWRTDPTTTMIVLWIGTEADARPVNVAVGDEAWTTLQAVKSTARPYPADGLVVHQAEITGLTPGTTYRFRLGDATTIHQFQTMPAKATDTFTFVSGGDAGVGTAAIETNRLAAKQDPMFALIAGDLAYENGVSIQAHLQFHRNYTAAMHDRAGRIIPMLALIGNHEVGKIEGKSQSPFFDATFGDLYADYRYGTLDFGDYLSLVMLDTAHRHPVEGAQTDWLDHTLAERTERPHLIVAQHVPSYPTYRSFETTGVASRKHWIPLFEKHNVDVVLEHHDHTFKRTHGLTDGLIDKNGLVYLGDGSWGKIRPVREPEKRPYLAKWESEYHLTVHRLEGDRRFHLALAQDGRVADALMTGKRASTVRGQG